jgi:hypothetical protein
VLELEQLLKEFKDVFAWTYKDLKGIPPELAQHKIELDTIIPLAHHARYRLNLNLCYSSQTRYRQVVSSWIYSIYRGSYMVVTHSSSTQEKW